MPDPCGTKDSSDCPYEKWNYKYMGDLSATSRLSSCNLISKVSEHGPLCILGLIAIESVWRPLFYHQTRHRPIFPHAECKKKKKIKRKKWMKKNEKSNWNKHWKPGSWWQGDWLTKTLLISGEVMGECHSMACPLWFSGCHITLRHVGENKIKYRAKEDHWIEWRGTPGQNRYFSW